LAHAAVGRRARGFSLAEICVGVAIVAVLLGLLLPAIQKARAAERSVGCLSSLREISLGFRFYAGDSNDRFPNPQTLNYSWEVALKRYVKPDFIFSCPADNDLYAQVGSSYDWRDTGDPVTSLAGRAYRDVRFPICVLSFDALPGWHVRNKINVVFVDGSARSMDQEEFFQNLDRAVAMPGSL